MKFPFPPFTTWTFAEDFLHSKTTHLAVATLVASALGVLEHRLPVSAAFFTTMVTFAIAFLRDAHTKATTKLADLLYEGLHLQSLGDHVVDGEADAK